MLNVTGSAMAPHREPISQDVLDDEAGKVPEHREGRRQRWVKDGLTPDGLRDRHIERIAAIVRVAPPVHDPTGLPATPLDLARIRYREEAEIFEQNLARHIATNMEPVTLELRRLAKMVWDMAIDADRDVKLFGSDDPQDPGAVGTDRDALEEVVESGNVRELAAFFFHGLKSRLLRDLVGFEPKEPPAIEGQLALRRRPEIFNRYEEVKGKIRARWAAGVADDPVLMREQFSRWHETVLRLRLGTVVPSLSDAEMKLINPLLDTAWELPRAMYEMPMSAPVQLNWELGGGLMTTGISGSVHRIAVRLAILAERQKVDINFGLLRLGLLATNVLLQQHSFAEAMEGFQLAMEEMQEPPPSISFIDTWTRYENVFPLTKKELRAIAREGKFPREHAEDIFGGPLPGTPTELPPIGAAPLVPTADPIDDIAVRFSLAEVEEAGIFVSPEVRTFLALQGSERHPLGDFQLDDETSRVLLAQHVKALGAGRAADS
ncbi:hypothetical protein [Streptomyces sp. NPDC020681]|uniref:hypothetical protein n=1 Tax=Streptomyces sp. NPDC020681 TaxID=3365083 RepID=UPI003791792C